MEGEPYAWNVLIIGAWNAAILTPNGIKKRLFELPEATPVEVEVSLDQPAPHRVIYDGIVVTPLAHALEVSPRRFEFPLLKRATEIARKALQALPETPTSAVGVNIRYNFGTLPDELIDMVKAPIDQTLSDADFAIKGGVTKRALTFDSGVINVEVSQGQAGDGSLTMNFHRDSTVSSDLQAWLSRVDEFVEQSRRILRAIKTTVQKQEEPH